APGSAARHVFERAGVVVDVDGIEERLQRMPVVEVAGPALGRLPLGAVDRRRVPDVDVLELRPHAEVGVRDVEQARVESKSKPGVVEPELDLVRVLAHDELLAGSSSHRRFSALLLTRVRGPPDVSASGASTATLAASVLYGVAVESSRSLTVFFAYRDSAERRAALAQPVGSAERYRLFGLDELAARGAQVRHNLERERQ